MIPQTTTAILLGKTIIGGTGIAVVTALAQSVPIIESLLPYLQPALLIGVIWWLVRTGYKGLKERIDSFEMKIDAYIMHHSEAYRYVNTRVNGLGQEVSLLQGRLQALDEGESER